MKKPTCTLYGWRGPPYENVHVDFENVARHTKMCLSVFSFIPQRPLKETKKKKKKKKIK